MRRPELVVGTLVGALTATFAMRLMAAGMRSEAAVLFSAFCIPLIYIFVAYLAATALGLDRWATLVSPTTPPKLIFRWAGYGLALAVGLQLFVPLVYGLILLPFRPKEVLQAARTTTVLWFRWPGMSPMVLRSLVGSPISEELLFRGCLLSFYQAREVAPFRIGKYVLDGSNVLCSLAFALFHLVNQRETVLHLTTVWVISMFLGKAKKETGGLLAPVICHFLLNFVGHTAFQFVPK